jgi:hypothetical protein
MITNLLETVKEIAKLSLFERYFFVVSFKVKH